MLVAINTLVNGETKAKYTNDTSSARKKLYWIQASRKLCSSNEFDAFGLKKDWHGNIRDVSMSDSGRVYVLIGMGEHGNRVSAGAILEHLVESVLDLKNGDPVVFSGYFKKGKFSENECLSAGLDSNPELYDEIFKFSFTSIKKR